MYIYVLLHEFMYSMYKQEPLEARGRYQILGDSSCRWLWAAMWVLKIELESSARGANALTAEPPPQACLSSFPITS